MDLLRSKRVSLRCRVLQNLTWKCPLWNPHPLLFIFIFLSALPHLPNWLLLALTGSPVAQRCSVAPFPAVRGDIVFLVLSDCVRRVGVPPLGSCTSISAPCVIICLSLPLYLPPCLGCCTQSHALLAPVYLLLDLNVTEKASVTMCIPSFPPFISFSWLS